MAIPKKIRQQVYDKCGGHCAYCGKEITYKDMQVEIARLTKDDGIGMQEMTMQITQPKMDGRNVAYIGLFSRVWTDGYYDKVLTEKITKNDGLSIEDWKAWFKECKENCLAIIHFTPFRY